MEIHEIPLLRNRIKDYKKDTGLTALRKEFDVRKREEWQEILRSYDVSDRAVQISVMEQELARLVAGLHLSGVSKKDLCEAYGTKDYGTINRLIESALPEIEADALKVIQIDEAGDFFEVTAYHYHGFTGTVKVFRDSDGYPMLVDGELTDDLKGTQLHQEIAGGATGEFSSYWEELAG